MESIDFCLNKHVETEHKNISRMFVVLIVSRKEGMFGKWIHSKTLRYAPEREIHKKSLQSILMSEDDNIKAIIFVCKNSDILVHGSAVEDCKEECLPLKQDTISAKHICSFLHRDDVVDDDLLPMCEFKDFNFELRLSNLEAVQSSYINCCTSSKLDSSFNHQSSCSSRKFHNLSKYVRGIAESNEGEDIILGNPYELYKIHLKNQQYDNDRSHSYKDCYYYYSDTVIRNLVYDQELIEKLHHGEKIDKKRPEKVINTKKDTTSALQEKKVPVCAKKIRKKCTNLKAFKMCKFRMRNIIGTISTGLEKFYSSRTVRKTVFREMLWMYFETKVHRNQEEGMLFHEIKHSHRRDADREALRTNPGVEDVKAEKVAVSCKSQLVCSEDSNKSATVHDHSVEKCLISEMLHVIKDHDLDNTKKVKNVDFLPEQGDIRSYLDTLSCLGLSVKISFSADMFWRRVLAYPFTQHEPELNTQQNDPHSFMDYEVFRLCSFSYTRFPANFDVWVTQLAQAGFYCLNENGQIICFDCGLEFEGAMNTPVNSEHRPGCRRYQRSRPLHMWTQGLSHEVLSIYYNRYGSLRPSNFEATQQSEITSESAGSHDESSNRSEPSISEPQIRHTNEHASDGSFSQRVSVSSSAAIDVGDHSLFKESYLSQYPSEPLSSITSETSHDSAATNEQLGWPGGLNDASSMVVREESLNRSGSHQVLTYVLTSVARNPMPFYNASNHGGNYQQGGGDVGAVGGSDSTLDLSKASYPLFSSATARRETFSTWNPAHFHRPDDLVAAGFFYAGYADCVRCFYCGLGLKYWRDSDIPAYQHARYRPHCVYNRLYKGQEYINRVQQDIQAEQDGTNQATNQVSLPRPQTQDEVVPAEAPPTVQAVVTSTAELTTATVPRDSELPNSTLVEAALRNGWQRNQVQEAIDHIVRQLGESCLEIGLLLDVLTNLHVDNIEANLPSGDSTGSSDSGINDNIMVPSNLASIRAPFAENLNLLDVGHGVDVSDCPVEQVPPPAQTAPIQPPLTRNVEFSEIFRSLEREHTLLTERTTCRVCQIRPVSCIYLPCGHVIACQQCADIATYCVFCTTQIVGTANVYLA